MNRWKMITPAICLALLSLAAGCTVEDRGVVHSRRPADRVEVVPERPSPRHTWVRGRWENERGDWVWVGGRWEER